MKAASRKTTMPRPKKLVLIRGRASEIRAAVHAGVDEKRIARAALKAVSPLDAVGAKRTAKKLLGKSAPKSTSTK